MLAKPKEAAPDSRAPVAELAETLRTLGSAERLEILRLLDSGDLNAGDIAGALRISPGRARRHLAALVAAGLVEGYPGPDGRLFRIDRREAAVLNASVVSLLGRAASALPVASLSPFDTSGSLPMSVPTVPERCLECQNATFVRSVLEDLDTVLAEARQYHERLQQLSSQVLAAHEAERKRIARELHDDTAQALTSILVRLRLLERSAENGKVRHTVEELRDLTSSTLDSVRRMAVDLRPAALDDLGLVAALRSYVEKFSERWLVKVDFSALGLRRRLSAPVELVLYRVVQEALSNVARHSGATAASVVLGRRNNVVTATVRDNGRGFDVMEIMGAAHSGLGLFGMKERLALVGGSLQVESDLAGGTAVTARVALSRPRHSHN